MAEGVGRHVISGPDIGGWTVAQSVVKGRFEPNLTNAALVMNGSYEHDAHPCTGVK